MSTLNFKITANIMPTLFDIIRYTQQGQRHLQGIAMHTNIVAVPPP